MYASRNIALCTKDCLCLFVCPTGATDTETGQIDKDTCIDGCRACVDACPSHAIYLVTSEYPEPAPKDPAVRGAMTELCDAKMRQERVAGAIATGDGSAGVTRLARALVRSCRILAEDSARESGYLTPQCRATRELLDEIARSADDEIRSMANELAKR